MILEKNIILSFPHYKSTEVIDPRARPIWTPGHGWQDLCRGSLDIAINIKAVDLMVSEEDFVPL